ncbi:MAG: DUF2769 domain-containing protein [Candidatus Nanoarchaeia archaeon]|nr:DUF2769 domain-containing protein [Candidatus Nanoarchaeia archaeon]
MKSGMDKKEAAKECMCASCHTFKDCGELAFCFSKTGRSRGIKIEKSCLCRGCPVHEKMGFRHVFFCTRGGEKKQTTKTERAHFK